MSPSPGYTDNLGRVCPLRKSLYGLKQASRQWYAKFSLALTHFGFVQSVANYSLFVYDRDNVFLAILVYVDDLILAGNSPQQCQEFKSYLDACFKIKDLGRLKYFLEIEVSRELNGLFLCQRKYALDILNDTGMLGAKPVSFPIETNHKLTKDSGPPIDDPSSYRRLVGRLIYLTITVSLDLTFVTLSTSYPNSCKTPVRVIGTPPCVYFAT